MKKSLFICLFMISCLLNKSMAQNTPAVITHEYYIMVHGVGTTADANNFQQIVSSKPGVTSITPVRTPIRYFLVRSTNVISMQDVKNWISNTNYELQFLVEDAQTKAKLDR